MCRLGMVSSNQEWGSDSGSGSVSGTEPIKARMQDVISLEVTHGILEWTLVVLGSTKEEIFEFFDGHFRAFGDGIMVWQLGAYQEPKTWRILWLVLAIWDLRGLLYHVLRMVRVTLDEEVRNSSMLLWVFHLLSLVG